MAAMSLSRRKNINTPLTVNQNLRIFAVGIRS